MTIPPQQIFTVIEATEYLGITNGHLLELLCNGSLKGSIFIDDLDDSLGVDGAAIACALAVGSPFFQQDTFICKARGEVKFNSPVPLELKNIMLRVTDLAALLTPIRRAEELSSLASSVHFVPTADYSSVIWNGKTFRFGDWQAKVVRVLHETFKTGTPEMHQDKIATAIKYDFNGRFRLDKLFRKGKKTHPAFGTLIKKVDDAIYKLDL